MKLYPVLADVYVGNTYNEDLFNANVRDVLVCVGAVVVATVVLTIVYFIINKLVKKKKMNKTSKQSLENESNH